MMTLDQIEKFKRTLERVAKEEIDFSIEDMAPATFLHIITNYVDADVDYEISGGKDLIWEAIFTVNGVTLSALGSAWSGYINIKVEED